MTNKIRDLDVKLDIISKLLDAIEKYPEERIGQIIYNCVGARLDLWELSDLCSLEDSELLKEISKKSKPLE